MNALVSFQVMISIEGLWAFITLVRSFSQGNLVVIGLHVRRVRRHVGVMRSSGDHSTSNAIPSCMLGNVVLMIREVVARSRI